jgi:hypothetical protein
MQPHTPCCLPTSHVCGLQFLHIFINTCYCLSFYYSHVSGCAVVSHCGFSCISVMTMMLNIFSCVYWPFVYIFGEMSMQVLCSFLFF